MAIELTKKSLNIGIAVAATYTSLQLISNIASLKVGQVASFSVDMGTFCYPLTFTLRDIAHRFWGKKVVTELVWLSALLSLFASGYFALCAMVPPTASMGQSFNEVFSPMWRLVSASIIAMLISGLVDTHLYQWASEHLRGSEYRKVLLSNTASIPLDNFIFAFGAFAWILPWQDVCEVFLFNLVIKFVVSLAGLPLICIGTIRTEKDKIC